VSNSTTRVVELAIIQQQIEKDPEYNDLDRTYVDDAKEANQ